MEWLWPGYLPLAKLAMLDGPPGTGKSTLTLDIAARVTTGRAMPDGSRADAEPAGVVLWTAEDGVADTVVPRMRVAGADLDRVLVREVVHDDGADRLPHIADLQHLYEDIEAAGAKLVVIDPVVAFVATDTNIYNDQQVRRSLGPLSQLAQETGATFLLVRHLTKQLHGNPINAGGGSIGMIGAARSGLLCMPDRSDPTGERKVLTGTKNNLAKRAGSLAFHIEDVGGVSRIAWDGPCEETAESLLWQPEVSRGRPVQVAMDALRELLSDGPIPATEVFAQMKGAGCSESTVRRAQSALGIRSRKAGMDGGWMWELPAEDDQKWRR